MLLCSSALFPSRPFLLSFPSPRPKCLSPSYSLLTIILLCANSNCSLIWFHISPFLSLVLESVLASRPCTLPLSCSVSSPRTHLTLMPSSLSYSHYVGTMSSSTYTTSHLLIPGH